MTKPAGGDVATPPRRATARIARTAVVSAVVVVLFAVPWWALLVSGARWPTAVVVAGSVVLLAGALGLPALMAAGHGRRHDRAAVVGDTALGAIWVLFVWSVLGQLAELALRFAGVADPLRSRITAAAVLAVWAVLLAWGWREAMRLPRVATREVTLDRLGAGLDGLRVVVITDTHFGPIDRARWSAAVADEINTLDADVVCHLGDIADGTVKDRRAQAEPLATVRARSARVYVTGNHEYFSEAQGWVDFMTAAGWDALRNRHLVVQRGGDRLVIAGVDDATAASSGERGHGQDLTAALAGAEPGWPVMLLAHQPKRVGHAAAAGVDLQLSGHTHGGQIWPFGLLVRLDQPVVHGLSRHGARTQLYTSRGTGFWGPPLRVFAPSEITLLVLRAG